MFGRVLQKFQLYLNQLGCEARGLVPEALGLIVCLHHELHVLTRDLLPAFLQSFVLFLQTWKEKETFVDFYQIQLGGKSQRSTFVH